MAEASYCQHPLGARVCGDDLFAIPVSSGSAAYTATCRYRAQQRSRTERSSRVRAVQQRDHKTDYCLRRTINMLPNMDMTHSTTLTSPLPAHPRKDTGSSEITAEEDCMIRCNLALLRIYTSQSFQSREHCRHEDFVPVEICSRNMHFPNDQLDGQKLLPTVSVESKGEEILA